MRVLYVPPRGEVEEVDLDMTAWSYGDALGGNGAVEFVRLSASTGCYLNDEAEAQGLEDNPRAEAVVRTVLLSVDRTLTPGDFVCGPALFVGCGPEGEGADRDVPPALVALARAAAAVFGLTGGGR